MIAAASACVLDQDVTRAILLAADRALLLVVLGLDLGVGDRVLRHLVTQQRLDQRVLALDVEHELDVGLFGDAALAGLLQQDFVLDQPLLDHRAQFGRVLLPLLGQLLDPGVLAGLGNRLVVDDGDVLSEGDSAGQCQGRE